MDQDIENIFGQQAEVLPDEVRRFVASGEWEGPLDGIIAHYNLSEDDADSLRTEISLVLTGLVHPNEFRSALGEEIKGVDSVTLDALAAEIGVGIFAPIRPALERFFVEQEEGEEVESEAAKEVRQEVRPPNATGGRTSESEVAPPTVSPRSLERMPDIAPDNLPTGEIQSQALEEKPLIPPLKPKMRPADDAEEVESEDVHPFEEKMKKVFTGGTADMGDLALSPTPPSQAVTSRAINDPYREPLE